LVTIINSLNKIELGYLMDLFKDNFTFVALGSSRWDIIWSIDCAIENEYDKVKLLLSNIKDHTTWKYDEKLYIEEEKNGIYEDDERSGLYDEDTNGD